MQRFEIPINNYADFEMLEHEMIDEITNMKTLENWKRQGSRIVRRKTEYVYTSVLNTPFAVAIASPSSFGRYYIDLPSKASSGYEAKIKLIRSDPTKVFNTSIQLYNCSYNYRGLAEKLLNPKNYNDFCIKYLFADQDQVLAIKSDLVLHDIYYNLFNYSIFTMHPNLVKSSFYGTYSGITFYLPVTLYRPKTSEQDVDKTSQVIDTLANTSPNIPTTTTSESTTKIIEPIKDKNFTKADYYDTNKFEVYNNSENFFSLAENIKHSYSFEKQYYTRAVEFSDYMRTTHNRTTPISIYFLNETTSAFKDANNDTISAAIPIWLDKVPASVAGTVYDARLFKVIPFLIFFCNT